MSERLLNNPPKPSGGRISRLFTKGKMVIFGHDEEDAVVGWVQALTRTQREEALMAAALAASRARLTYVEGNPDYDLLMLQIQEEPDEELADGVIAAREMSEIWALAEKDLHADAYWRENDRLELIRAADAEIQAGQDMSPEEASALFDLNVKYNEDWRRYAGDRIGVRRQELLALGRAELSKLYVDAAVSIRTIGRQSREYNVVATFNALRRCSATRREDGSFNHGSCGQHSERNFYELEDVRDTPDEVIDIVVAALADLDSAANSLGG